MNVNLKTRSGKIVIAISGAMAALVLMAMAVLIMLQPTTVVIGKPASLNIKAALGYESAKQVFIKTFPDFSATDLHYSNPYLGPSEGPWGTLTINAGCVSAKASDTSIHVTADMLDVSVNIPLGGVFQLVQIKCKSLVGDIQLWTPNPDTGEFGVLTATLKGDVYFHIPNIPGLPEGLAGGYHYEGNSLTITMAFYEPIYSINIEPESLTVPQGGVDTTATVTVTPKVEGITGTVTLNWPNEYKEKGICGWFNPAMGTPPFTATLKVEVEGWAEPDSYMVPITVHDWVSGKDYKCDMQITVLKSGYTITVNGSEDPVNLGDIPRGSGKEYEIKINNWTSYSGDVKLYWKPTFGDFSKISVEMPAEIVHPPYTGTMKISVDSEAQQGTYKMEICVFDEKLKREFKCQVEFKVT